MTLANDRYPSRLVARHQTRHDAREVTSMIPSSAAGERHTMAIICFTQTRPRVG